MDGLPETVRQYQPEHHFGLIVKGSERSPSQTNVIPPPSTFDGIPFI